MKVYLCGGMHNDWQDDAIKLLWLVPVLVVLIVWGVLLACLAGKGGE